MNRAQNTQWFLVLDQGGHASRALIVSDRGDIKAQYRETIQAHRYADHRVEYDGSDIVHSFRSVISQALQDIVADQEISAVAMATQRSNIICWDSQSGEALSPVFSWQDRRTATQLPKWQAHADDIHRLTGLHLSPHYGASKLRWCLDHLPGVNEALRQRRLCMGPMSSYLTYRLLDERPLVADPANASRTLLWDIEQHGWSDTLLDIFRIPRQSLPRCVPSTCHFGTLSAGSRKIPLQLVTGDQAASLYALGKPLAGIAYITVGTGAFIQCDTGKKRVYSRTLLSSISHIDESGPRYSLEGTVNGAGSALALACETFGLDNIDTMLPDWLANENEPPLYINGVSGLGTPYLGADIESRYVGDGNTEARIVAVVESILFLIQVNLQEIVRHMGELSGITLGGGLANLAPFCQRLADLSGLPVRRSLVTESTSLGLACLLAGQPSSWPGQGKTELFSPSRNNALKRRFQQWHDILTGSLS